MDYDLLADQYASFIVDRLEYDCLIERAAETIYQETLKCLKDGSIEPGELLKQIKEWF